MPVKRVRMPSDWQKNMPQRGGACSEASVACTKPVHGAVSGVDLVEPASSSVCADVLFVSTHKLGAIRLIDKAPGSRCGKV